MARVILFLLLKKYSVKESLGEEASKGKRENLKYV